MNLQHIAPRSRKNAYGNDLTHRLSGRAKHPIGFISSGAKRVRIRRGSHAESLLRFAERCLLCLFFVMDGQHLDHSSCMLAWSTCHEAGLEGA